MTSETRIASAAALGGAGQRLVSQPLEIIAQREVIVRVELRHQNADQLLLRVDPKIGVVDPTPRERADGRDFFRLVRRGDDAEPVTESAAVAAECNLEVADLIARHLLDRLGFQQPLAIELPLVQEHLKEPGVVGGG